MQVSIIQVPYHLGRPHVGVGRGPGRLVLGGLATSLTGPGVETSSASVEQLDQPAEELELVARLTARTSARVRAVVESGAMPVVLAGDCNAAIGILGGLAAAGVRPGVLWLDAHGDLNTPETSISGFLDGMAIAIATGRCHDPIRLAACLDPPLPEERVVLAAVRDLDAAEERYLADSPVRVVPARTLRDAGADAIVPALDALRAEVADLYVHLDLDALDPAAAPATGYPTADGLTSDMLAAVLRAAASRFRVRALAVTNYDPSRDDDDRTLGVAMRAIHVVVREAARR